MYIVKIEPIPSITIDPIPSDIRASHAKKERRKLTKKQRRLLIRIAVPLLIISWLLTKDYMADVYTVVSYSGDSRVMSLANSSGMNMNGKALFLSQSPEIVTASTLHSHCPMEDEESIEFGCYIASQDKIYLLEITASPYSEITHSVAAHEMLHVAWQELDTEERNTIATALRKHMNQNKEPSTLAIRTNLEQYIKNEDVQINEIHSFVGSELFARETDDLLDNHYNKYFSDRSTSPSAKARFETGISMIESDIENRKSQVTEKENELTVYVDKWLDPIEYYMQRNAYYGDYYNYNKNVEAYNNNLKIYKSKYNDYETYLSQLNTDIDNYNAAISAMSPGKQLESITPKAER